MNQIKAFKDVKRYLEWREIQDKLTKRLKNYKFPNELQQQSITSEDSDEEMDMFFKMDEDIQPQPVSVKKEEVSPRSVLEIVTPPVEPFVPVEDCKDENSLFATPIFSYNKSDSICPVVQVPVASPPHVKSDPFFAPSPFIPATATRSLLGFLLEAHANNSRTEEEMKTIQVFNKEKAQFIDSDTDFSEFEFVMNEDVAHLDNSMESFFETEIGPIRTRYESDESYHSYASSLLEEENWPETSSVSSENSIDSNMMFRLSI